MCEIGEVHFSPVNVLIFFAAISSLLSSLRSKLICMLCQVPVIQGELGLGVFMLCQGD